MEKQRKIRNLSVLATSLFYDAANWCQKFEFVEPLKYLSAWDTFLKICDTMHGDTNTSRTWRYLVLPRMLSRSAHVDYGLKAQRHKLDGISKTFGNKLSTPVENDPINSEKSSIEIM